MVEYATASRAERRRPSVWIGNGGVGKSRIAKRLADLLAENAGPASALLNVGGFLDNRTLGGTSRGWANPCPTFPVVQIARTKCPNPSSSWRRSTRQAAHAIDRETRTIRAAGHAGTHDVVRHVG